MVFRRRHAFGASQRLGLAARCLERRSYWIADIRRPCRAAVGAVGGTARIWSATPRDALYYAGCLSRVLSHSGPSLRPKRQAYARAGGGRRQPLFLAGYFCSERTQEYLLCVQVRSCGLARYWLAGTGYRNGVHQQDLARGQGPDRGFCAPAACWSQVAVLSRRHFDRWAKCD